jgi:hypothetical protein
LIVYKLLISVEITEVDKIIGRLGKKGGLRIDMSENHRLEEAIKAGVPIPKDGYWGDVPSKICGAYGGATRGNMVKEGARNFENKLVKDE